MTETLNIQSAQDAINEKEKIDSRNLFSGTLFNKKLQSAKIAFERVSSDLTVKNDPNYQKYLKEIQERFNEDVKDLIERLSVIDNFLLNNAEIVVTDFFQHLFGFVLPKKYLITELQINNLISNPIVLAPPRKKQWKSASREQEAFVLSEKAALVKSIRENSFVIWPKDQEIPTIPKETIAILNSKNFNQEGEREKVIRNMTRFYWDLIALCDYEIRSPKNSEAQKNIWLEYKKSFEEVSFPSQSQLKGVLLNKNPFWEDPLKINFEFELWNYIEKHKLELWKYIEKKWPSTLERDKENVISRIQAMQKNPIPETLEGIYDWCKKNPELVQFVMMWAETIAISILITFGVWLISAACPPLALLAVAILHLMRASKWGKAFILGTHSLGVISKTALKAGAQEVLWSARSFFVPGVSAVRATVQLFRIPNFQNLLRVVGHSSKTTISGAVAYGENN